MKNWIKEHPIASYFTLTILWSFSFWSMMFFYIKPGGLMNNPPPITFLFVVLGGFGPTISGLIMTRLIYGKEGMQAIWQRLTNWQVGWWWLAILIIPATTFIMPLIRSFTGVPLDWAGFASLIGPGLALGILAGLMEEFGWRGFLLPHLLKKYSPLVATLLLGLVFWGGIWHGYADFFGVEKGNYTLIIIILLGPLLLTAWSLILTTVYKASKGSLLMSILVHASISSSALIFGQKYTSVEEELLRTTVSVLLAFLAGGVFWMINRKLINSN